eukprot:3150792-Pleurochrysis_carterae.AAC.1
MPRHEEHGLPDLTGAVDEMVEELREVEGKDQDGEAQECGGVREYHAVRDCVRDRGLDIAMPLRVIVAWFGCHRARRV